jgi:hypothetical protein
VFAKSRRASCTPIFSRRSTLSSNDRMTEIRSRRETNT